VTAWPPSGNSYPLDQWPCPAGSFAVVVSKPALLRSDCLVKEMPLGSKVEELNRDVTLRYFIQGGPF